MIVLLFHDRGYVLKNEKSSLFVKKAPSYK